VSTTVDILLTLSDGEAGEVRIIVEVDGPTHFSKPDGREVGGRALHSSTYQLNLSHFVTKL